MNRKFFNFTLFASTFLLSLSATLVSAQSIEIYLSNRGKEGNSGAKNAPITSLYEARELLKERYEKSPFKSATIYLNSGKYELGAPLVFDPSLFGGDDVELTIKSIGSERAVISGGAQIPASLFKPVGKGEDPAIFHDGVMGKLYVADLSDSKYEGIFIQNIDDGSVPEKNVVFDYTDLKFDTENYKTIYDYSTVTYNDDILRVAAWPNRGFAHFNKILEKGPTTRQLLPTERPEPYSLENPTGARFTMEDQTDWKKWEAEFNRTHDIILEGYPNNDWYYQYERLGKVTGDLLQLLRYTRYGVMQHTWMIPRRVKFMNVLCELDEPGEWYFDHENKKLYIYPIASMGKKPEIRVLNPDKMFVINDMNGFKIENIEIRNGGTLAVEMNGCNNSLIAGCRFFNSIGKGFLINDGVNNGVVSNDFEGIYSAGSINAGDPRTLTPCNHYITNNRIHDCTQKGYGMVGLNGVGITFSNNLLYNLNGAVSYTGCNIIIEKNEFYNMGSEMNDWNVVYTGARWQDWGNEVRYNFVHHLIGMPSSAPLEAFRNDDMGMGTSYYGNVFYKAGKAAINFSGSGNDCYNNIILKTYSVWRAHFGSVGDKAVVEQWNNLLKYESDGHPRGDKGDYMWKIEKNLGKMAWKYEPFKSAYPVFGKIMSDGFPWRNTYCTFRNNYLDDITEKNSGFTCYKAKPELMLEGSDWEYPVKIDIESAFIDPSTLNFQLRNDYRLVKGFQPIPFAEIGLYKDAYRVQTPDKDAYRKAIKDRYENYSSSGKKYDKKTANDIYPVPYYLQ